MSNRHSELPQRPDLVSLSACLARLVNLVSRQSASHRFLSSRTSSVEDSTIRSRIARALTGVDVALERRRAEAAVADRHRLEAERGEATVVMLRKSQDLVREAMGARWTEPLPPDVLASVGILADKSQTDAAPEDLQADGAALVAAVRSWADRASGSRAAAAKAQQMVHQAIRDTEGVGEREKESLKNAAECGAYGERVPQRAALFLLGVPGTGRLAKFERPDPTIEGNSAIEARHRGVAKEKAQEFLRVIGYRGKREHPDVMPSKWMMDPESKVPVTASRQVAVAIRSRIEHGGEGVPVIQDGSDFLISRHHFNISGETLARRLPLCATDTGRLALANLPFVPVPKSAREKNIRNLFQLKYWSGLSKNLCALRGSLCCICGAPVGAMAIGGWPVPRKGDIEVHEAWAWSVADKKRRIGIQRLVSLLPVCLDCHKVFHADQTEGDADKHARLYSDRAPHLQSLANSFLISRRADMISGAFEFPYCEAISQVSNERQASTDLSQAVDRWIVDLSSLRLLDIAGAPPVLNIPDEHHWKTCDISGVEFHREDGQVYPAVSVHECLVMVADEIDRAQAFVANAKIASQQNPTRLFPVLQRSQPQR